MVEENWVDLEATELRYRDRTWKLTGDVDVRENGDLLVVEAREADDVRHRTALLHFGRGALESTRSLNPGELGEHFHALERDGEDHFVVVKKAGRRYRYELHRLEYE